MTSRCWCNEGVKKGTGTNLCEAPFGPFRQKVPDTFFTLGQRPDLLENPRVADRAAGDCHAVHAGLAEHVEAILGGE